MGKKRSALSIAIANARDKQKNVSIKEGQMMMKSTEFRWGKRWHPHTPHAQINCQLTVFNWFQSKPEFNLTLIHNENMIYSTDQALLLAFISHSFQSAPCHMVKMERRMDFCCSSFNLFIFLFSTVFGLHILFCQALKFVRRAIQMTDF